MQLAVTGALLFQIRFFDTGRTIGGRHAWRRLAVAVVLGSTPFGCLYSIRLGSGPGAAAVATAVTVVTLNR